MPWPSTALGEVDLLGAHARIGAAGDATGASDAARRAVALAGRAKAWSRSGGETTNGWLEMRIFGNM